MTNEPDPVRRSRRALLAQVGSALGLAAVAAVPGARADAATTGPRIIKAGRLAVSLSATVRPGVDIKPTDLVFITLLDRPGHVHAAMTATVLLRPADNSFEITLTDGNPADYAFSDVCWALVRRV